MGNVKGGHIARRKSLELVGELNGDMRWKVGIVARRCSDPIRSCPELSSHCRLSKEHIKVEGPIKHREVLL